MKKPKLMILIPLVACLAFLSETYLWAAITPSDPWQSEALVDPSPPPLTWNSSIAHYEGRLVYAGNDQKVYAYDLGTGNSTEILDLGEDANFVFGPSGFLISRDNHLYFHDNGKTGKIYRIDLAATWPPDLESFDTGTPGGIFAFTQNPWTDVIWFSSGDFPPGNMYLHEVNGAFTIATERASFPQPHGGGNGPIIFMGPTTLLYGESVYLGDGYFHLMDSTTGRITAQDHLVFTGGLASAAYGYNNVVYATAGGGKTIYEVRGASKSGVAFTQDDAQGMAFDGVSFFVSTQVPFSGGENDGAIAFHELWNPHVSTQVTPTDPYRAQHLGEPDPAVLAWNSALAYYDSQLFYAGEDKKIYAYNVITGDYAEVLDLNDDPNFGFGPSGFLVTHDSHLYFHDNGNTDKIYRIDLTASEPVIESLDTGAHGSIFAFTQNPWTDVIWFASGDFPPGDMYLYEVNDDFTAVTQRASFPQPHGGGNGPIIFKAETTLLYGESAWGGDGYFHVVDGTTGNITHQDYLVFDGGLAGAAYGYDHTIYATTGAGKKIFQLQGSTKAQVATADDDAQGIVFDGGAFYMTTQSPIDGTISGHTLWRLIPTGVPAGQEAPAGTVDGDLAVNAQSVTEDKAIGVSAGDTHTVVEYLEAVDPDDIDEQTNRPHSLPFGLVSFRLKETNQDGTASAIVHLSEAAPKGSKWYRYDPVKGWYDYSEHATFSADRTSVTLAFKDGGYGDDDRIVNGYVLDPGGVGLPKESGGGGGGGCFIDTAGSGGVYNGCSIPVVILVWGMLAGCSFVLKFRTMIGAKSLQSVSAQAMRCNLCSRKSTGRRRKEFR